jgi:hypothetical protein
MKKITLLSTRCLLMLWLGLLLTTGVRAQSANFFVYGTSTHIGDLTVLGCDDQYYLVSTFAQGTHTWTLPTGMVPASGYTVNDPVIKVTVLSAFVTSSVGHSVVYSSVTYNDSKTLTKYPPITNTLSGSVVYVCGSGNAGTITGSTPTGGMGGTYSYQWYRNNSSGYTAIPGATSKDYSPGVITETTTYYREVYQTINCNCRLSSTENITVLVVQGISITDPDGNNCHYMSYDPPVIDGQTTTGGMASPASYQWQSKVGVGGTYSNISGATSEDYNPGVLTTTTYFRRLVTKGVAPGSITLSCTSNEISIIISSSPCDIDFNSGGGKGKHLSAEIVAYPNPTDSYISVSLRDVNMDEHTNYRVVITDLTGKQIVDHQVSREEMDQELQYNLERGMYFISLIQDGIKVSTQKIVKL